MPEQSREWESDAALKHGLSSLSPQSNEQRTETLNEDLLSQLKSPSLAPAPVLPLRLFLRQILSGAVCAGAISAAFLLSVLKTPYLPSHAELRPNVVITPPPAISLDSLLREKTSRAANLWSRPADVTSPFRSPLRKSDHDGIKKLP